MKTALIWCAAACSLVNIDTYLTACISSESNFSLSQGMSVELIHMTDVNNMNLHSFTDGWLSFFDTFGNSDTFIVATPVTESSREQHCCVIRRLWSDCMKCSEVKRKTGCSV
jgi:hypothetical protein